MERPLSPVWPHMSFRNKKSRTRQKWCSLKSFSKQKLLSYFRAVAVIFGSGLQLLCQRHTELCFLWTVLFFYVSDSVNKRLNCRRDSSSLTFCCLSFTLCTYYILHTFCTVEPRVIGWMWFCLGFFIHSVWIVWQMQRIPHILTLVFLFLCLIRHLASLRISYQQPLHSSELGTRVTELYNGIKICRLSKS